MDRQRDAFRRDLLCRLGAANETVEEVLGYTANPFDPVRLDGLAVPLPDEPHVEAWSEYLADARARGVLPALASRLVQLQFPIRAGISQTDEYRAATRRGVWPEAPASPALEHPDRLGLVLHETAAGRVPILTAGHRPDFVALVRACSCRNEPDPVPDSMGACIVVGLNNWDRVARHRRHLEAVRGTPMTEDEWTEAFRALVPCKDRYQDRFIILSRAPYSAVLARDIGMDDEEWLERSVAIRLEHECTHYFTLRVFGVMRNHLLDEFLADFAGLAHAFGKYDSGLFLRFLGLEDYPTVRPGGRLPLYLGKPPLSGAATAVVCGLVVRAARRVEACTNGHDLRPASTRARLVAALAGLTLEELASEMVERPVAAALAAPPWPSPLASP